MKVKSNKFDFFRSSLTYCLEIACTSHVEPQVKRIKSNTKKLVCISHYFHLRSFDNKILSHSCVNKFLVLFKLFPIRNLLFCICKFYPDLC